MVANSAAKQIFKPTTKTKIDRSKIRTPKRRIKKAKVEDDQELGKDITEEEERLGLSRQLRIKDWNIFTPQDPRPSEALKTCTKHQN